MSSSATVLGSVGLSIVHKENGEKDTIVPHKNGLGLSVCIRKKIAEHVWEIEDCVSAGAGIPGQRSKSRLRPVKALRAQQYFEVTLF